MAYSKRLRQLVQRDDRRISLSALESGKILLTETGTRLKLFLGQPLFPSDAGEIFADECAHVHDRLRCGKWPTALSTIVCILANSILELD